MSLTSVQPSGSLTSSQARLLAFREAGFMQDPGSVSSPLADTSLWASLSEEIRDACVGDMCSQKCNSQFRWEAKGQLRDTIWRQQTLPVLEKLEEDNISHLYGRRSKQIVKDLGVGLLGRTDDPRKAHPTILILISSKRVGLKMKSLFENHQHFKKLNSGLAIEVWRQRFKFFAGDPALPSPSSIQRGPFDSLCGSSAYITKLPPTGDSIWRKITIGGVLHVPERDLYYGVTVAHCFDIDRAFGAIEGDDSSESESDAPQGKPAISTTARHEDSFISTFHPHQSFKQYCRDNAPFGLYVDSAPNDTVYGASSGSSPAPKCPALVGNTGRFTRSNEWFIAGVLDCAFVQIDDTRFKQRNCVKCSESAQILPCLAQHSNFPPDGRALLAAGVSGVREVTIYGAETSFKFPWTTKSTRVWSLKTDVVEGDSGSWVFSPDGGRLYGMVVAAIPELRIAYVTRAEDILEHLAAAYGCGGHLNNLFPLNRLGAPRLGKNEPRKDDGRASIEKEEPQGLSSLIKNATSTSRSHLAPPQHGFPFIPALTHKPEPLVNIDPEWPPHYTSDGLPDSRYSVHRKPGKMRSSVANRGDGNLQRPASPMDPWGLRDTSSDAAKSRDWDDSISRVYNNPSDPAWHAPYTISINSALGRIPSQTSVPNHPHVYSNMSLDAALSREWGDGDSISRSYRETDSVPRPPYANNSHGRIRTQTSAPSYPAYDRDIDSTYGSESQGSRRGSERHPKHE